MPALVSLASPEMDTNFAAVVKADGSLVGMYRDHEVSPGVKGKSTMHLVHATHWKDNTTYTNYVSDLLFGDEGLPNPGGVEDPFLYFDSAGNFHGIFHMLYAVNATGDTPACEKGLGGGHAFSPAGDGLRWTWTGLAYCGGYSTVADAEQSSSSTGTGSGQTVLVHGDRPHLLFDKDGRTPVALTNSASTQWGERGMLADQTYTFLRPVANVTRPGHAGTAGDTAAAAGGI
jgi:hypothetical protein